MWQQLIAQGANLRKALRPRPRVGVTLPAGALVAVEGLVDAPPDVAQDLHLASS